MTSRRGGSIHDNKGSQASTPLSLGFSESLTRTRPNNALDSTVDFVINYFLTRETSYFTETRRSPHSVRLRARYRKFPTSVPTSPLQAFLFM